jgi:hypothetical protein
MTTPKKIISGSTALRRMHCPGSYQLEAKMPEQDDTSYAAEGTLLHEKMEYLLDTDQTPDVLHGSLDEDLIQNKLWPAYRGIQEVMQTHQILDFDLELKYEHKHTAPGCEGTLDFVGKAADGRVVVADFKFGAGEKVFASENYQLAFYTIGLLENDDEFVKHHPHDYIFVIIQPWRDDETSTIDEWETDAVWLESFRQKERYTYERIRGGEKTLKAGRWCKWCKGRPVCSEHNGNLTDFVQMDVTEPRVMDSVTLGKLLDMGKQAEEQYKVLLKFAEQEVAAGRLDAPAGHKLVESLGNREWVDEAQAKNAMMGVFGVDAFDKKLKTPSAAEKLAKKEGIDFAHKLGDLVVRKTRGYRLVPDTDRRPQVSSGPIDNPEVKAMPKLQVVKGKR